MQCYVMLCNAMSPSVYVILFCFCEFELFHLVGTLPFREGPRSNKHFQMGGYPDPKAPTRAFDWRSECFLLILLKLLVLFVLECSYSSYLGGYPCPANRQISNNYQLLMGFAKPAMPQGTSHDCCCWWFLESFLLLLLLLLLVLRFLVVVVLVVGS